MLKAAALALPILGATVSAAPTWVPASRLDLSKRQDEGAAFIQCLTDGKLEPVVQGDDDYDTDSEAYNKRFTYKPVALVYPNDTEGVAAAVKCAADNKIKVNARSGGHSYAAYGLGGEDGHLIVSLDNLRDISLDGEKASLGSGNRVGDIVLGLYNGGKRALAHATGHYVGLGGQAAHGGFGLASRAWGLLLDQVYEVEVVTAKGEVVTANKEENSDLFYGIRGAAPSFGIATTWKANTHAAAEHNVWATWTWNNFTAEDSADAIQKWQEFAVDIPVELGLQIVIAPGESGNAFTVRGLWIGDDGEDGANKAFAPLLEKLPAPSANTIQDDNWLDSAVLLAGAKDVNALNTTTAPDSHDTFHAVSLMVPEDNLMTADAALSFSNYLWNDASKDGLGWFVILDVYGGKTSVINKVSADETSFSPRDTLYSMQLYGSSGDAAFPSSGVATVQGMSDSITKVMSDVKFKGYANYVDGELSREDAHAFYYPDQTEKLESLKATWDPDNVFDFPQGFLPAGSS